MTFGTWRRRSRRSTSSAHRAATSTASTNSRPQRGGSGTGRNGVDAAEELVAAGAAHQPVVAEVAEDLVIAVRRLGGIDRAFRREIGLSLEELSAEWKQAMQNKYLPTVAELQRPRSFAEPLLSQNRSGSIASLFVAPALSYDGKYITYVAYGSFLRGEVFPEMYLANAETGLVTAQARADAVAATRTPAPPGSCAATPSTPMSARRVPRPTARRWLRAACPHLGAAAPGHAVARVAVHARRPASRLHGSGVWRQPSWPQGWWTPR